MIIAVIGSGGREHSICKKISESPKISKIYCDILNTDTICFSLATSRSCKRFHIDNVPVRLLVTYYGIGTEWIPSNACDYTAYYDGKNNNSILFWKYSYESSKENSRHWIRDYIYINHWTIFNKS